MSRFNLGDKVWRVQGELDSREGLYVHGPATVTALVKRKRGCTYLLTWGKTSHEITDEQDSNCLHSSLEEAQKSADEQHNANLDRQKRG